MGNDGVGAGSARLLSHSQGWLTCIPTPGQSALVCCPDRVQSLLSCVLQPWRVRASSPTFVTSGPALSPAADGNGGGEKASFPLTCHLPHSRHEGAGRASSPEQDCFELAYSVLLGK